MGFVSVPSLLSGSKNKNNKNLILDSSGIIDLPKGFDYNVISEEGQVMNDGLLVPSNADGMTCFQGENNNIILIRNHEIGHVPRIQKFYQDTPFGKNFITYIEKNKNKFYDIKGSKTECFGCTTTIVYNLKTKQTVSQFLSLGGTLVNCSGGVTPWGTWITCEETVNKKGSGLYKNHGYAFEVKPTETPFLNEAIPLKKMGRFRREAVCINPLNGDVFQTEDRDNGLFYKYIPKIKNKLEKGGQLQAMKIQGFNGKSTANWTKSIFEKNQKYKVEWINIKNYNSPKDNLRNQGRNKGCATFARGEGMYYYNGSIYFTATTGGKNRLGQIWKYNISTEDYDTIELIFESSSKSELNMPDNIIVAPWGDIIICEDGKGRDRLVGIKPNGEIYYIASNALNNAEFAGVTFSPDGSVLFVNIYNPTMTLAISGPWDSL